MDISAKRDYSTENGTICVQRHFLGRERPFDIVRRNILQQANDPDSLTSALANDILSGSLRESQ